MHSGSAQIMSSDATVIVGRSASHYGDFIVPAASSSHGRLQSVGLLDIEQ